MAHRTVSKTRNGENGGTTTITKRGRAVGRLAKPSPKRWRSPAGILAGKAEIVGDIIHADESQSWNPVNGHP